ncbi:MAG: PBP1A family penicillin-binding protein [Clostridiaceae bacterium]|nr:PBP1A family penicillin-binding protein [Clostridiaceae bacterium]
MNNTTKLFLKVFVGIALVGVIVATGIISGALLGVIDSTKDLNINELSLNATTFVYYTDEETGEQIEYERLSGEENRVWVDITDTPDYLWKAFVAIEDERFFKHKGFDIKSTSKAVFDYVLRRNGRGASTITQQLIKNITGDKEVKLTRKIKEIIRAVSLERKLSKQQILELYINTVYLSQGCYGVGSASDFYFGKNVSELSLAECASIAGITQYPAKFDPVIQPENNKEKQELILSKMEQLGYIDKQTYEEAVAEELAFVGKTRETLSRQSYFVDQVVSDVLRDLQNNKGFTEAVAAKMLYSGGLIIHSTVDPVVQGAIDKVYADPTSFKKAPSGIFPESAMVVIEPQSGEIKGIVGGRGEKTASLTLNRAVQSYRQPGSAIKPIAVYAPAVENNIITPATVFADKAISYGDWAPRNYYAGFRGNVTISYALEQSINTIPVQIMERMGANISRSFMQNNLGITSLTNNDANLAVALGGLSKGVSPLELTSAYSVFVNRGIYTKPITYTKVFDSSGRLILENKKQSHKAISEQTATIMANMLKGVVDYGTGASARFNSAYATGGKTGTTDNDVDRWFVGFTPYYVASVWVGCDTPRSIAFFGSNPCIPVWRKVMQQIHTEKKLAPKSFPKASGIVSATYCVGSGKLPGEYCSNLRTSYFKSGTQPYSICEEHIPNETELDEDGETNNEEGEKESDNAGQETQEKQDETNTTKQNNNTPAAPDISKAEPAPAQPIDLGDPNV